jgi:hypothetical protein
MTASPTPPLAEAIAAAQAWWREAGVEHSFHDTPQPWLAEPEAAASPVAPAALPAPPPPPPKPRLGGERSGWPTDLTAFREWWNSEPSLDPGGTAPRLAPRGEAGAAVMFLVPMPEPDDREQLLAGPVGRLLGSLATAMGHAPEQVYLASALPRCTPHPDWDRLAADGLGEVVLHHLTLAAPQRLIVLGQRILPLLGHDPAQAAPAVGEIAIQPRPVPFLAAISPEALLGNGRQRAGLWRRWLEWTDGD